MKSITDISFAEIGRALCWLTTCALMTGLWSTVSEPWSDWRDLEREYILLEKTRCIKAGLNFTGII